MFTLEDMATMGSKTHGTGDDFVRTMNRKAKRKKRKAEKIARRKNRR